MELEGGQVLRLILVDGPVVATVTSASGSIGQRTYCLITDDGRRLDLDERSLASLAAADRLEVIGWDLP